MTVTDELVAANQSYQEGFAGPLPLPPARKIAVIACMDARLDPAGSSASRRAMLTSFAMPEVS